MLSNTKLYVDNSLDIVTFSFCFGQLDFHIAGKMFLGFFFKPGKADIFLLLGP